MNTVDLLNSIILITFTIGLLATTISIGRRLVDYYKEGLRPPLLAKRDIALLVGLSLPFLLILGARAFGLSGIVRDQAWWSLITGLPAIIGVLQFAYIEYFIIEKTDSRGYLKYLSQAIEEKERRKEEERIGSSEE